MLNDSDLIVAVSSAPGAGLRGIVRISGSGAWEAARGVVDLPAGAGVGWHGGLELTSAGIKGACLGAAILFKAPRSYTGEDVAELHLPNSPALLRLAMTALLQRADERGYPARIAEPGEFSARAFLHGKMDLTEAEGVAATISASNHTQLRAAAVLRTGALHKQMTLATERVAELLAKIEAGIDFSEEEDISFIAAGPLFQDLEHLSEQLGALLATSVRIDRLGGLPTVVFIGKPNVGKSSLINVLSGSQRSLVSEIAGTTRDMLSAEMPTPDGALRLVDVPGDEISSDLMRTRMMEARRIALLEADLVVRVVDDGESLPAPDHRHDIPAEMIVVQNKVDLIPAAARHAHEIGRSAAVSEERWSLVSAKTGENIPALRERLARITRRHDLAAGSIVLNQRHRLLLLAARATLADAMRQAHSEAALRQNPELLAAELRRTLDILGEITGAVSPDQILGKIFGQFCIGK